MTPSFSTCHHVCCFVVVALMAGSAVAAEPPLAAPVPPEAWNTWPLHFYNAAISPDGKRIAVRLQRRSQTILYDRHLRSDDGRIPFTDKRFGKLLLFTPNSKLLVGHHYQALNHHDNSQPFAVQYAVRVWDAATGRELRCFDLGRYQGLDYRCYGLTDKALVVPGRDEVAAVYDIETGKALGTFPGSQRLKHLALSADGKWMLTADTENTLHVWDVQKRVLVNKLCTHADPVEAVAISPDGVWCASATKSRLWVYERATTLEKARGHTHDRFLAKRLLFTPNAKTLVAVGKGKPCGLFIWDWQSSREMRGGDLPDTVEMIVKRHPLRNAEPQSFTDAAMLTDGSVVTWNRSHIRIWDLKPPKVHGTAVQPSAKK